MPRGWNGWYHCTEHTYGTWLRGDPRGWRARHHREHVDGDYKNPPTPGTYDKLHEYSKSLMKRDPVRIAHERRQFVLTEIVGKLLEKGLQVRVASLDGTHLHILARFPDHDPRHWLGIVKKHTSHRARTWPDYPEGGLWAKRGLPKPIVDEQHFRNVEAYIKKHVSKDAAVWRRGDSLSSKAHGWRSVGVDS